MTPDIDHLRQLIKIAMFWHPELESPRLRWVYVSTEEFDTIYHAGTPFCVLRDEACRPCDMNLAVAAVNALPALLDELEEARARISHLESESRKLRPVAEMAAMLIQPRDDGPQLEGHKSFRERLMRSARDIRHDRSGDFDGAYHCICALCGRQFTGHKRQVCCKACQPHTKG